jgi:hypothetical protein
MANAYQLLNDSASVVNDADAKYKVTSDSMDCLHSVASVQEGINGPVPVVGVPYWTRWMDYNVYSAQARIDFQTGLLNSLGKVYIAIGGGGIEYQLTNISCTASIFVGDVSPVQVWQYHMEFMRPKT